MKKIAFAGSFDPITRGHMHVLCEGLNIADRAILMIAANMNKKCMFSESDRTKMIMGALKEYNIDDRVDIVFIKNEYVAQAALERGCEYLIRGIRSFVDFDYEEMIQKINHEVIDGAKTIFVMPPQGLDSISSSTIKGLIGPVGWHWAIKNLVPTSVYDFLLQKYIVSCLEKYSGLDPQQDYFNTFTKEVIAKYSLPNRFYHNLEHLAHSFQELEWLISNYEISPTLYNNVAIAIAAHDIIYLDKNPLFSDEELSAQWLYHFLTTHKLHDKIHSVEIVRSTAHFSETLEHFDLAMEIMHDIDLAILGQKNKIYTTYSSQIRQEYEFVPIDIYKKNRIKALKKLGKEHIYFTLYFDKYEQNAHRNIENEIKTLA